MPPASFKQSQPWASRFERAEGEGGEEAGAGHGGDDGGGIVVITVVVMVVDNVY